MNQSPPPRRLGRSIAAIAGGFLVAAILSTVADLVCHATGIYPPAGQPMADGLWALALGYRLVFQALAGYLTAGWAPANPMRHVFFQGAIGTVLCAVAALVLWNKGPEFGPKWYSLGLVVTAVPSVWIGGWWRTRAGVAAR